MSENQKDHALGEIDRRLTLLLSQRVLDSTLPEFHEVRAVRDLARAVLLNCTTSPRPLPGTVPDAVRFAPLRVEEAAPNGLGYLVVTREDSVPGSLNNFVVASCQSESDAKFFAATPRLLTSLIRLIGDHADLGEVDLSSEEREALDEAREAIADATGPGPAKGEKGGECNRAACSHTDARWFNSSTRRYYCQPCAQRIMSYPENAGLLTLDKQKDGTPTIFVALDSRAGTVKAHVPRQLGAKVEFLDCDEPDVPGLKARGIPHPTEESAALERDPAYDTHEENL